MKHYVVLDIRTWHHPDSSLIEACVLPYDFVPFYRNDIVNWLHGAQASCIMTEPVLVVGGGLAGLCASIEEGELDVFFFFFFFFFSEAEAGRLMVILLFGWKITHTALVWFGCLVACFWWLICPHGMISVAKSTHWHLKTSSNRLTIQNWYIHLYIHTYLVHVFLFVVFRLGPWTSKKRWTASRHWLQRRPPNEEPMSPLSTRREVAFQLHIAVFVTMHFQYIAEMMLSMISKTSRIFWCWESVICMGQHMSTVLALGFSLVWEDPEYTQRWFND